MENPLTLMASAKLLLLSTMDRKVSLKALLLEELRKYLLLVSDKAKVSSYRSCFYNKAGLSVNKQTIKTEPKLSLGIYF